MGVVSCHCHGALGVGAQNPADRVGVVGWLMIVVLTDGVVVAVVLVVLTGGGAVVAVLVDVVLAGTVVVGATVVDDTAGSKRHPQR